MVFREVPNNFDNIAGDSSAAFRAELPKPGDKTHLAKPGEGVVAGAVDTFSHPLLATTNLTDFNVALNDILAKYSPEALRSVEIPPALQSMVSDFVTKRTAT